MSSSKPKGSAGWNDPPMFSYETRVQGEQGAKLNLTKRVSFPLAASGSPLSSQPIPVNAGPPILPVSGNTPPTQVAPPPLSLSSSQPHDVTTSSHQSGITFKQIYDNLEPQIDEINQTNEKAATDIKKKINILEAMWNENKFSSQLKSRILELSKAVLDKNKTKGDELQRSLMVDDGVVCSSWIPAIRHLLNSIQDRTS